MGKRGTLDLRTIQELGGWPNLAMVQRYAHLISCHKKQGVERIAENFHNVFHNNVSLLALLSLKKDVEEYVKMQAFLHGGEVREWPIRTVSKNSRTSFPFPSILSSPVNSMS
jgi:hypothetical protein